MIIVDVCAGLAVFCCFCCLAIVVDSAWCWVYLVFFGWAAGCVDCALMCDCLWLYVASWCVCRFVVLCCGLLCCGDWFVI